MNKPKRFFVGSATSTAFLKGQHLMRQSSKQKNNEETQKRIAEYVENLTAIEDGDFATANAMQRHTLLNLFLHENFKNPDNYIGATRILFDQFKFLDNTKRNEVLDALNQKIVESRYQPA